MRTLKDFAHADGSGFFKKDECDYEDAETLLQCGFLKHCGCFDPEANLRFVASILTACSGDDHDKRFEMRKAPPTAFAMYQLTEMGFLEHGSSIPGWITEKGKEFLALINEAFPNPPSP